MGAAGAAGAAPRAAVEGVVDAAIHHRWPVESEVLEYLDTPWRRYIGFRGRLPGGAGMRGFVPRVRYANPAGADLPADGEDPSPSAVAADAGELVERRLVPDGVDRALLLFDQARFIAANPNPYLASGLARGLNDWCLDRWLSRDERLYGAALVPLQDPDEAVAELRRIGGHPKIAAVMLGAPMLGKTLGHPVYHPVYREAEELGLPVIVHRGCDNLVDIPTSQAGGYPMTFAEYEVNAPYAVISQLGSLLTNGVLDKFPALKVYLCGTGLAWLPGYVMRFELVTHELRREVPWMQRTIGEYLADQVRIGTYGLERGRGAEAVAEMARNDPQLARTAVYASGFPSWDTVEQGRVADVFDAADHPAVFGDNAAGFFRWPELAPTPVAAAGGPEADG